MEHNLLSPGNIQDLMDIMLEIATVSQTRLLLFGALQGTVPCLIDHLSAPLAMLMLVNENKSTTMQSTLKTTITLKCSGRKLKNKAQIQKTDRQKGSNIN